MGDVAKEGMQQPITKALMPKLIATYQTWNDRMFGHSLHMICSNCTGSCLANPRDKAEVC